jgi:translation initiation factor IF-2
VIETERDAKKGISATLVIKDGTLSSGMCVVCGTALSPVRLMENFLGKKITEASFSSPYTSPVGMVYLSSVNLLSHLNQKKRQKNMLRK